MEAITMSELARSNSVTLKIGHDCVCPCPCCHGNQAIEYSLIIIPWHLRDQLGLAPVVRLKCDELGALLSVIEKNRPGFRRTCESISGKDEAVSFRLWRNDDDHWLGEFSLHVMGGGVDDIFPVCESELDSLVQKIKEMDRRDEAAFRALAGRKERENKIKSRMKRETLQEIKQKAKQMNSGLFEDELGAPVATVLLAAAFFAGPYIERLVESTGYSRSLVSDISCRMHDSGLWANGEVFVEHWFNEQLEWELEGLSADCSVATGCMVAWRAGEHESWSYEPSGRLWSHRAT
jgi:hypothetical protein